MLSVFHAATGTVVTVVISFEEMQRRVTEESSHFAVRQRDGDGSSLFEEFVLDEGYETKFRSYFYFAQGELTGYLSAYLAPAAEPELVETERAGSEDWVIQLLMPRSFQKPMAKAVGVKIEEFVESYIMYRWLETKVSAASAAATYMATSDKLKAEICAGLNRRSCGIVRPNGYW